VKIIILVFTLLSFSSGVWSQKANVTHAAMEFNKLVSMRQNGATSAKLKQILISAKNHIDQAASHVNTQNSTKMYAFKGIIYYELAIFMLQDEITSEMTFFDNLDISIQSFTKGLQVVNGKESGKSYIHKYAHRVAGELNALAWGLKKSGNNDEANELFKISKSFQDLSYR